MSPPATMADGWDFSAMEERDGLRMTWNEWPATKAQAAKTVIPVAALYVERERERGRERERLEGEREG